MATKILKTESPDLLRGPAFRMLSTAFGDRFPAMRLAHEMRKPLCVSSLGRWGEKLPQNMRAMENYAKRCGLAFDSEMAKIRFTVCEEWADSAHAFDDMKTKILTLADFCAFKRAPSPEFDLSRTAYRPFGTFDTIVQQWPSRAAMLKTIEMQGRRAPNQNKDWRAFQP